MEQILKQILDQLTTVNDRLDSLETGVNTRFDAVDKKFDAVDKRFDAVDERLDRIEERLNATFDQTGGLSEFRTETLLKLDNIDNKIEVLAGEMGKQKLDIEMLKRRPV